jgi:hypothetical protein
MLMCVLLKRNRHSDRCKCDGVQMLTHLTPITAASKLISTGWMITIRAYTHALTRFCSTRCVSTVSLFPAHHFNHCFTAAIAWITSPKCCVPHVNLRVLALNWPVTVVAL